MIFICVTLLVILSGGYSGGSQLRSSGQLLLLSLVFLLEKNDKCKGSQTSEQHLQFYIRTVSSSDVKLSKWNTVSLCSAGEGMDDGNCRSASSSINVFSAGGVTFIWSN